MPAPSGAARVPIHTIIFDLGRTLVHFSLESIWPALASSRAESERLMIAAECGAVGADELKAGLCRLGGIAPGRYAEWWNSIFASGWLVPPEWIRGLHHSYRLGLLSNTNPGHFAFLRQQRPLLGEFDFTVLSYAVGAAKPDPRIYAAAEAEAGCEPECIFYADDVPAFVEAARSRGWQAMQFTGFDALRARLEGASRPAAVPGQ